MLASRRFVLAKQSTKIRHFHTQRRAQQQQQQRVSSRRLKSTITSEESSASEAAEAPTTTQLWRVFCHAALPMIGFGFTDQTVMIQAGNAIDCTLGVTFGLSTLTAAAFGQICSDASGVVFGGTVERIAKSMGLPSANLTNAQRQLPIVSRVRWAGSFIGIIAGCCLGLVNLLFIDVHHSSTLKLQALNEEQEFEFSIEASNAAREDATRLTVKGPDVDGLLASMTAALAIRGASIVEIHAQREHPLDKADKNVNDIFYVVKRDSGEAYDDDELEELAQGLLDSARTPMNVSSIKAAMNELETTNSYLQARVKKLEQLMYEKQITVVSSTGESHHPGEDAAAKKF